MDFKARAPDFRVKVKQRSGDTQGVVGSAWKNNDGSVSVQLDPCIVLQRSDDVMITLFPIERKKPA